jgi:hypothetical protein
LAELNMTSRKKPGVAFWATVVVVVIALYVASFGPACWITSHMNFGAAAVRTGYRPMTLAISRGGTIGDALQWYAGLAAAPRWVWVRLIDGEMAWGESGHM